MSLQTQLNKRLIKYSGKLIKVKNRFFKIFILNKNHVSQNEDFARNLGETPQAVDVNKIFSHLIEFSRQHNFQDFVEEVITSIELYTNSDTGIIYFINSANGAITHQFLSASVKINRDKLKTEISTLIDSKPWIECITSKRAVIQNISTTVREFQQSKEQQPTENQLLVPLVIENNIEAIIELRRVNSNYEKQQIDMVSFICTCAWGIIKYKEVENNLGKLQLAVEKAQVSIVITDCEGIVEYANPFFSKLTGYSGSEYLGKNLKIIKSNFHPSEFYKELWDTIKSGKSWEGEFYNRKKNGNFYWEHATISPVFNSMHQIVNFVAVKSDITEKKLITQQLIAAKEKAEESNRLKSVFLRNISHEIRTPMNAIVGFSSLIEEYEIDSIQLKDYLQIITENVNKLLSIIDNIVAVSRIESDEIRPYSIDFDLNELYDHLIETYSKQKEWQNKQNINFKIQKHEIPFLIHTDLILLEQIFFNLIDNAFKFTNEGEIIVGHQIGDGQITFYVFDTGIGMASNKQALIFEQFVQLDQNDNRIYGGNGLGLTISEKIAKLLGGNIWVESYLNIGSTFFIRIPISFSNSYNPEIGNRIMAMHQIK
jgi:PAS domain S-box-containing protein